MVHAIHLTPESIIHAMEAGDLYASSGVTLTDVTRAKNTLAVEIQAEPGVSYLNGRACVPAEAIRKEATPPLQCRAGEAP